MAEDRAPVTLTLSVEVPDGERPPRRLAVSTTLKPQGETAAPPEVREALERLKGWLDEGERLLLGAGAGAKPDRSLEELVETYHPRDARLLDSLLWDGEISPTEHDLLLTTLRPVEPPKVPAPAGLQGSDRSGGAPRPPEGLVAELGLKDLKDANRARFRRLISYDEWVALKAYFAQRPAGSAPATL